MQQSLFYQNRRSRLAKLLKPSVNREIPKFRVNIINLATHKTIMVDTDLVHFNDDVHIAYPMPKYEVINWVKL